MWIYILLGVVGLLIITFLVISLIVAHATFYNKEKIRPNISTYEDQRKDMEPILDQLLALEKETYQDIYISSFDKVKLHGRLYQYNDSNKYAILFHGFQGTPVRDFSGGFYLVKDMGFNIIMVDERAHGLSDSRFITMGVKERKDVKAWANYVYENHPDSQIVLIGISMGAASVLMASDLDLPNNVKCIIADCPYYSPKAICCKTCKDDLHFPIFIGWPVIFTGALLLGFNLSKGDARKSVKRTKIPCLIIHGEIDQVVPVEMSEEIYLSNPEVVERYTFKSAKHGLSYIVDPEKYKKITNNFINKYI